MPNHVERPPILVEWHRCGRCWLRFPSHGAYVMHNCDLVAQVMATSARPQSIQFQVRTDGSWIPIPVRLWNVVWWGRTWEKEPAIAGVTDALAAIMPTPAPA
jgi:hypothetical protein